MRTPEEIKKGLKCCERLGPCMECAYGDLRDTEYTCETTLLSDALSHIQQLEAQAPRWISAKKPPKEEREYIVLRKCEDGATEKTTDIFVNGRWGCDGTAMKVAAWMSFDTLPDLPEGWEP